MRDDDFALATSNDVFADHSRNRRGNGKPWEAQNWELELLGVLTRRRYYRDDPLLWRLLGTHSMTITKARTEELTSSEIAALFREVAEIYRRLTGWYVDLILVEGFWRVIDKNSSVLARSKSVEDMLVRLHDKWSAELAEAVKADRVEEGK